MKRTLFVCVLVAALIAGLMLPAQAIPELFKVGIAGPTAPAFVAYQLNSSVTSVTFEIYPSTSGGVIDPPEALPIRTDVMTATQYVAKGMHAYLWPGTKDNGDKADSGYYLCVITAKHTPPGGGIGDSSNPPWKLTKIMGTYRIDMPTGPERDQWNPTTDPAVTAYNGFYGVTINTNPESEGYGRIYAPHQLNKRLYMYDGDGTFLAEFGTEIGWQTSAPYDTYVAKDGYVYVSDRSAGLTSLLGNCYCFAPDGTFVSAYYWEAFGLCHRGMMVAQTDDGIAHIYSYAGLGTWFSGAPDGEAIFYQTLQADHTTWSTPIVACDTGNGYGLWVAPDRSYLYACEGGAGPGLLRRWNKGTGDTYTLDATWTCPDLDPALPEWTALTEYTATGAVRYPTTPNGHRYQVTTIGTTDATEPTWPTTGAVTDGTVVWTRIGGHIQGDLGSDVCESPDGNYVWVGKFNSSQSVAKFGKAIGYAGTTWTASTLYAANAVVNPTVANGFKYQCTVGGTSDAIEATWPTTEGAEVIDGGVTWTARSTTPLVYNSVMYRIKGIQCDALGNVLLTGGYGTSSYSSWFWAMGTEGNGVVEYTREKQTGAFEVTDDLAPVVVPESATWTFSATDPVWAATTAYINGNFVVPTSGNWNMHRYICYIGGITGATEPVWPTASGGTVVDGTVTWQEYSTVPLKPDGTDTATLTFKVLDADGWGDISAVKVDLSSLKLASDAPVIVDVDSIVEDTSDTAGRTAICTLAGITAVNGTRAGIHDDIVIEPRDGHYPTVPSVTDSCSIIIEGATFTGTVKHLGHFAYIGGATITVTGGTPGAYGYPFTYITDGSNPVSGEASIPISEGSFTVVAAKLGYKAVDPIIVDVTVGQLGSVTPIYRDVNVGPITIAEAKALPPGTTASIAGICFAQPEEWVYDWDYSLWKHSDTHDPAAGHGLDLRLKSLNPDQSASMYRQWYMCDSDDPSNGLLFHMRPPLDDLAGSWGFAWEMTGIDPTIAVGIIPQQGDLIWVKGVVNWLFGYEKYCVVGNADDFARHSIDPSSWPQSYWNQLDTPPGGSLPAPLPKTVAQIYHDSDVQPTPYPIWGQYATVENATPIAWLPNSGAIIGTTNYYAAAGEGFDSDGTGPLLPGGVDTLIVMDAAGINWCAVVTQSRLSLEMPDPPVDNGDVYTFTGAGGRRARTGVGALRLRGAADAFRTLDRTPPVADNIGTIRGAPANDLNLQGIVTAKFSDCIYVESADRSSGVRVNATGTKVRWASVGDKVWFNGDTLLLDGQKQVNPTTPLVAVSSGNPMPYLGIRCNAVGGRDYSVNDPGVYNGLGALNVGLYVTMHGLVTYRDGVWVPAEAFAAATNVIPTAPNGHKYVSSGGTTGTIEPVWPLGVGATVVDGSVTWTENGAGTTPAFFYLWDGGNRGITKIQDGNPITKAYGVRIAHSGYLADPDGTGPEIARGVIPWTDWVEVEGPVSVNLTVRIDALPVPEIRPAIATRLLATGFTDVPSPAGVVLPGKNLLGIPCTPGNVGNGSYKGILQPYDPAQVISYNKLEFTINNKLIRWDSVLSSLRNYSAFAEPHGIFGGIILGDGYWLTVPLTPSWDFTYKARVQNIPQWIAPGAAGNVLIANPVNNRVMCDPITVVPLQPKENGIMMSDGSQVKSFREARFPISGGSAGWIKTKGNWFLNSTQSWRTIGISTDFPNTRFMEPWMGVWFTWQAGYEDTSMIVPAGFPPP